LENILNNLKMVSRNDNLANLIYTVKNQNKLVLFIGAGVNAGITPFWDQLLNSLIKYCTKNFPDFIVLNKKEKQKVVEEIERLDNYEKASVIKYYLKSEYLPALHEILYFDFNILDFFIDYQSKYPLLFQVAQLAQNTKVTAIISYNYDEILRKVVLREGRRTVPIYGLTTDKPELKNALPIYYIHGFVPLNQRIPEEADSAIVLSQDEYFNFMTNDLSWQTVFQLNFLMNAPCLFIGCSLKDINMLRLLSLAKKGKRKLDIFALTSNNYFGSDSYSQTAKTLYGIKENILDEYGVKVINAGNYYSDIPLAIEKINMIL